MYRNRCFLFKEGVTEREVVNHIEQTIKQYGVNEMSFDTMVLFGDHAASPHGTPGDRRLKAMSMYYLI